MKKGFKKALLKYYWLSNCSFNLKKKKTKTSTTQILRLKATHITSLPIFCKETKSALGLQ